MPERRQHHEDDDNHGHPEAPAFSARAFGRLQVLHPISLLLLIASLAITTTVIKPSLDSVARLHPTFFNPNNVWLLGYWALLLLLQVGTALSVALASGNHTKALLTNGMGPYLPLANLCVAIWAPLFIVNTRPAFIAGEAFLGAALLLLLASTLVTGVLRSYRPTWRRPIEWLLVHLPTRLLLAVLLQVDIWQQGFILFGLAENGSHDLKRTVWPTFIIVVSTGVVTAFWSFATTDIATGGASIFLQLALLFKRQLAEHRPTEVFAAHVLSIALIGTGLIAAFAWGYIRGQQHESEGRVALPIQPHEDAAVAAAEAEAAAAEQRAAERREEAQRLRGEEEEPTPSQLERGEGRSNGGGENVAVTRKLGHD